MALLQHCSSIAAMKCEVSTSGVAVPSRIQEFMKAMMCFMVEFWDVARQPRPPIEPMSEPYIDFEYPLAGWCIHLPQVCHCRPLFLTPAACDLPRPVQTHLDGTRSTII